MDKLISIDNGGTLTDVVVIDGERIFRAKTLTTPHDLSKCFFDGLRRVSREIYGREDLPELLRGTDLIRYSTTQGTNALVERRGPRLGLILGAPREVAGLAAEPATAALFAALVGERVTIVNPTADDPDSAVLDAVNALTGSGANRIVVSLAGADYAAAERSIKRIALRRFPPHMLGTVPMLYSHEVIDSVDPVARTWTALINAFLHPAMETFLYHADNRLREHPTRASLLIFRNDGGSARVAKTKAIKSYGSGPRGGLEGARAFARHYGLADLLALDVGGTTTDIGRIRAGEIAVGEPGRIEGVAVALPLAEIVSAGVGGGSVLRVRDGRVQVGPDSVGAVPGPACFARGGTDATITDVMLLAGVIDASTYFGGELALDPAAARAAVERAAALPLGLPFDVALHRLCEAWVVAVAEAVRAVAAPGPDTTLAAFGGAGPLLACAVAEVLGATRVLVPATAAVFSALGIGFSDLMQEYRAVLDAGEPDAIGSAFTRLHAQAGRDMAAEGIALADCALTAALRITTGAHTEEHPLPIDIVDAPLLPRALPADAECTLVLRACRALPHPPFAEAAVAPQPALAVGSRLLMLGADPARALPVYPLESQMPGATASGPAIVEDRYYTGLVPAGWAFELNGNRDLWLRRTA
ncbi:MAG: hydantoinase/oxoprolinase family protein [Gammaproteobacteria bacterium]|nr:hydantoinase/oxoprolinase family protein [Gammaproteobacteria bacterium]